jgi:hypothetical protein
MGNEMFNRIEGMWNTPGSKSAIGNFFCPFKWSGVDALCEDLGMEVAEPEYNGDCAFLGSGTYGRVIRVRHKTSKNLFALKVSLNANSSMLLKEHRVLTGHNSKCKCGHLVVPMSNVHFVGTDGIAGYVMQPVGTDCVKRESLTTVASVKKVFSALHSLHSHDASFYHGDARLSNLITVNKGEVTKLVWIDVAASDWTDLQPDLHLLCLDISVLAKSVLGLDGDQLPADVSSKIKPDGLAGGALYEDVAVAVFDAMGSHHVG